MIARALVLFTRLAIGASPQWVGQGPSEGQCIYFANHASHLDTLALWTALPPSLRKQARPVAAKDYWGKTAVRRKIALDGLRAVLIDRKASGGKDPLKPLAEVLEAGDSLIIFPEGTRHESPEPKEFKSGLYRLGQRFPKVQLVPVYLDNLHRSMPKGSFLPLPFLCRVRFGAAIQVEEGEDKATFLTRARQAILELR
ncbi:MAG: lysophospholipid acyltransferase family protein [Planctomycetota bacterium]